MCISDKNDTCCTKYVALTFKKRRDRMCESVYIWMCTFYIPMRSHLRQASSLSRDKAILAERQKFPRLFIWVPYPDLQKVHLILWRSTSKYDIWKTPKVSLNFLFSKFRKQWQVNTYALPISSYLHAILIVYTDITCVILVAAYCNLCYSFAETHWSFAKSDFVFKLLTDVSISAKFHLTIRAAPSWLFQVGGRKQNSNSPVTVSSHQYSWWGKGLSTQLFYRKFSHMKTIIIILRILYVNWKNTIVRVTEFRWNNFFRESQVW